MNRKQFIILLVLVAVVGTAGWLVRQHHQDSWHGTSQAMGDKLLPDFPINDLTQISLQAGTNELHLVRQDARWRVQECGNYPASFAQISDLLIQLADLKVAQSQEVGPSQLGRFELLPPGPDTNTGTWLQFKDQNGKVVGTLLLGKKHFKPSTDPSPSTGFGPDGEPDGRYVLVGENAKTLALISDPLASVNARPSAWLDKNFLRITDPIAVAIQYPEPTNSWQLTHSNNTNGWQLAGTQPDEKTDPAGVSHLLRSFSPLNFADVHPGNTPPEILGLTNLTTLTVATSDHFTYTFKIGTQQGENYPLTVTVTADLPAQRLPAANEKPADKAKLDQAFADQSKAFNDKLAQEKQFENWIYEMPAYTIHSLLMPRRLLVVSAKSNPSVDSSTPFNSGAPLDSSAPFNPAPPTQPAPPP